MTNLEFTLTREQFEAKRASAASLGFKIEGDKSEENQRGVKFSFEYVEPDLKLTIESVSFVDKVGGWNESRIAEELTKALTVSGENIHDNS